MTTDLPNAVDIDPDTIAEPVLTRQGWVTPAPDSLAALDKLQRQIAGHPDTSGFRRVLEERVRGMESRLRAKYQDDPSQLAELASLTQP